MKFCFLFYRFLYLVILLKIAYTNRFLAFGLWYIVKLCIKMVVGLRQKYFLNFANRKFKALKNYNWSKNHHFKNIYFLQKNAKNHASSHTKRGKIKIYVYEIFKNCFNRCFNHFCFFDVNSIHSYHGGQSDKLYLFSRFVNARYNRFILGMKEQVLLMMRRITKVIESTMSVVLMRTVTPDWTNNAGKGFRNKYAKKDE